MNAGGGTPCTASNYKIGSFDAVKSTLPLILSFIAIHFDQP